jgi:hypothetical protein
MKEALHEAVKVKIDYFWGYFQMFLEDSSVVSWCIRFSDETHFHLNDKVNK